MVAYDSNKEYADRIRDLLRVKQGIQLEQEKKAAPIVDPIVNTLKDLIQAQPQPQPIVGKKKKRSTRTTTNE